MKRLYFLLMLLCSSVCFAQNIQDTTNINPQRTSLNEELDSLAKHIANVTERIIILENQSNERYQALSESDRDQSNSISNLKTSNDTLRSQINSMLNEIDSTRKNLNSTSIQLSENIDETNKSLKESTETLTNSVQSKGLYMLCGIIAVFILVIVTYFILRHRIASKDQTIEMIHKTQEQLQTASIEVDNKLLSLLEQQLAVSTNQKETATPDHRLALKVADEITKIEMNLSRMDPSIKGYKQLSKAVERIKNNFAAQGYEIVELLGTKYKEGLRADVDFVFDENLPDGERRITSVVKPQVNFNGEMIQKAVLTVTQNI